MSLPNTTYDYIIKLLLVGNSGVGKSSILLRFVEDEFTSSFINTIGIDFRIRTVTVDDKRYKLQIWDTSGHERFRTITVAYFRGANGILLVYDVTNEKSFDDIKNWVRSIHYHSPRNVNMMLIGNKCDIKNDRVIDTEKGQKLADEYHMPFLETSAKNSINVEDAFISLVTDISQKVVNNSHDFMVAPPAIDINFYSKQRRCCNIL
jgi:Ras-related protein Rab-8A